MKLVFLRGGGDLQAQETFECHTWKRRVLLASRGWRPRMMLNSIQGTGRPPQQRMAWPQLSTELRLGNPCLEGHTHRTGEGECHWEEARSGEGDKLLHSHFSVETFRTPHSCPSG